MNDDIDIANTAIYSETSMGVGVNLDSAADQGVEISDELMDMAGRVYEDGQGYVSMAEVVARVEATGLSLDEMPRVKQYIENNLQSGGGLPGSDSQLIARRLTHPAGLEFQQEFLAGLACEK